MFDYDGKNVKTHIKQKVKLLQEKYGLGDAWVYNTKRGYHVYFFTDQVEQPIYFEMLKDSECCKGFRKATERNGYGTLRVSAKFTKFDIELEYILRSEKRYPKRMIRKAHVVQELIRLGQECGTHLASLFPQWARFQEDESEWRPPAERKVDRNEPELRYKAKRIKKQKVGTYVANSDSNIYYVDEAATGGTTSNVTWTVGSTTTI
jgi:hypothetical protein